MRRPQRLSALALAFALLATATACSDVIGETGTCLPRYSVEATVRDAVTGEPIPTTLSGQVSLADFSSEMERTPDGLSVTLAQPGTYDIEITAIGYVAWQGEVDVVDGGCVGVPSRLNVDLEPVG